MVSKQTTIKGQSTLSDYTQQQVPTQSNFFDAKVVPANSITQLWEAKDPNAHAQELFSNWIQ